MRNINFIVRLSLTVLMDDAGICGLRNVYLLLQRELELPMVDPDICRKKGREALIDFTENVLIKE